MKVWVKVSVNLMNLHSFHTQTRNRSVKVPPMTKNLHGILKLTVKVVTVVKVFGRIRKKNSV